MAKRVSAATPITDPPKMTISGLPDIATLEGFGAPQKVMVVGCGGTGAYVVGHIARLISVLNSGQHRSYGGFHLTLADGDKVEQKNLERQHFVHQDLGLNKAEALAIRYSAAFGLEIDVVSAYMETTNSLSKYAPDLLISCVDNNASRGVMRKWFLDQARNSYRGHFWIDSGNEENSGQVVCGFLPPSYAAKTQMFSLPIVTEVYPEMLKNEESKFNSQLSCAELAASAPQNMMTNITASTVVLNFAQKVLRGKALRAHGVVFSVDNSFRTMLNTPENLAKVNPNRRRQWETKPNAQTI